MPSAPRLARLSIRFRVIVTGDQYTGTPKTTRASILNKEIRHVREAHSRRGRIDRPCRYGAGSQSSAAGYVPARGARNARPIAGDLASLRLQGAAHRAALESVRPVGHR